MAATLEEVYGSRAVRRRYFFEGGRVKRLLNEGEGNSWRNNASKFIKDAFLPQGYPESVSQDYLEYQLWDTIQAFCSSITGALATLAILKGVGVGDSSATPLAATITWMLKDGTGMVGRIVFAWLVATDLDCNAKFWRLIADILNDIANFLELLAPIFPTILFLPVVCCASLAKAVVGTAGGATRAALIQHQARRDNMADVAAKDGSQETVVNLMALLVNLVITPVVAGKTELIWTLFVVFTLLHLLANHRAVHVVTMETLNQNRLHLLMSSYLTTGVVPSVEMVNAKEPILSRSGRILFYKLGVSLSDIVLSEGDYKTVEKRWKEEEGSLSILHYDQTSHMVKVVLEWSSDVSTQLKSAIAVEIVDHIIRYNWSSPSHVLLPYQQALQEVKGDIRGTLMWTQRLLDDLYSDLSFAMNKMGWVTSHVLLGTGEWRFSWNNETRKML